MRLPESKKSGCVTWIQNVKAKEVYNILVVTFESGQTFGTCKKRKVDKQIGTED